MSWWLVLGAFGLVSALSVATLLLQCLGCLRPRFRWGEGVPMSVSYFGRTLVGGPAASSGGMLGRNTTPGLPQNVLKRLPSFNVPPPGEGEAAATSEEECAVCQEQMSAQKVATLPCKHLFHAACLRQWLCRKATCPTCRMVVTEGMLAGDVETGSATGTGMPTAAHTAECLNPLPHEAALASCRPT